LDYRWTIKDLPAEMRPREKMQTQGPEALSNGELLAILIRVGNRSESALDLANRLLAQAGGLRFLVETSIEELSKIKGIGLAKASQIKAAVELGRRIALDPGEMRPVIRSPEDVASLLMEKMRFLDREHFQVMTLNTKNQVLGIKTAFIGSLNSSIVHPREIFKEAIKRSAAALILVHNHPSGDPSPSPEDLDVTRRLQEAGRLLGIEILDHVIIGDRKFYSLKQQGKM
jgi:DNA repair protein RadC